MLFFQSCAPNFRFQINPCFAELFASIFQLKMKKNDRKANLLTPHYITSIPPRMFNPLSAKLYNVNFHQLEVVGRDSETQLQVGEKVVEKIKSGWKNTYRPISLIWDQTFSNFYVWTHTSFSLMVI